MENKCNVTVFTPTYNRADKLERLYKSLLKQENKSFEWLIVDDGSTDNTKDLIVKYIGENKVNIRYIYKENGGKHSALNIGIASAYGEFFFCVDSDDYLSDTAISDIVHCISENEVDAIIAYKSELGKDGIIGDLFPDELNRSTLYNLINNYKCSGDRSLIYRTELIRNIRIPEPENTRFFPETYLYDRFDEKRESFLLRKSLCICEYLDGGYSSSFRMLMIRNTVSMKWFYAARIDMPCTLKQRYISSFRYVAFSMLARSKEGKYSGKNKLLVLAAVPLGILMYLVYSYYQKRSIPVTRKERQLKKEEPHSKI